MNIDHQHSAVSRPIPRVLSIAGTDPTGGAGLHADLKSIAAAGGYGMGVVTSLVAQNTQGVRAIHTPPLSFLSTQLRSVSDDVVVDAVKIGMLGDADTVSVVKQWLEQVKPQCVVLDPVMIASSGDALLEKSAENAVRDVCSAADIVTPNLPELAVLVDQPVAANFDDAVEQAQQFAAQSGAIVIVKGGHFCGNTADNGVVGADGLLCRVPTTRVDTKNTHGTGCSLSSAIATRRGMGDDVCAALQWATEWLHEAIVYADDLQVGEGHGPVDHFHQMRRLAGL